MSEKSPKSSILIAQRLTRPRARRKLFAARVNQVMGQNADRLRLRGKAVELGRRVIRRHTFGERIADPL